MGKGLNVGSYERAKCRWSVISKAMLPLVLDDTKLERMSSIQLVLDSVMWVATKIKGLKRLLNESSQGILLLMCY